MLSFDASLSCVERHSEHAIPTYPCHAIHVSQTSITSWSGIYFPDWKESYLVDPTTEAIPYLWSPLVPFSEPFLILPYPPHEDGGGEWKRKIIHLSITVWQFPDSVSKRKMRDQKCIYWSSCKCFTYLCSSILLYFGVFFIHFLIIFNIQLVFLTATDHCHFHWTI